MLTEEELVDLNARGLIPGPNESNTHFLQRIKASKTPIDVPLYGISIDWAEIKYGEEETNPIQPAFTEISEGDATIQIHPRYRHNREILDHEMVHLGRMAFPDSKYEEVLAAWVSPSRLRQMFGPMVQTTAEVVFFLLGTTLSFLLSLAMFWFPIPFYLPMIVSAFTFGVFLIRTVIRQFQLRRTITRLSQWIGSKSAAYKIAYRLTDTEIDICRKETRQKWEEYIEAENSLRWKMIKAAYLSAV